MRFCAFLSKIKTHLEQVYSGGIKGKVRFSAAAGRLRGAFLKVAARRVQRPLEGWLRKVRKTMGYMASDMAEDLEISPSMVFQLERSERKGTITLKRLKEVAWSMECELVYCIVPRAGKFEDQFLVQAMRLARGRR